MQDFDKVFLEIPVKNCIVGMLLTGPNEVRIIKEHFFKRFAMGFDRQHTTYA